MADLSIFQKYPNSWRMDQPDFSDVCKTTFAKGTITEFQKLQDDPIKVVPMVKVEVDGLESDFIPIFFHAKKQYWDDDEHQAQDLNEDEKYFEKAWMSFQGGDEVVVMMRAEGESGTLKPFAVLGFADGVPRIGEDIVKLTWNSIPISYYSHFDWYLINPGTPWGSTFSADIFASSFPPDPGAPHFSYLQCSKNKYYGGGVPIDRVVVDEEQKGPDGKDLGLEKEVPPFNTNNAEWTETGEEFRWDQQYWYGQLQNENIQTNYDKNKVDIYEWIIVIGGVIYTLSLLALTNENWSHMETWVYYVVLDPPVAQETGLWVTIDPLSYNQGEYLYALCIKAAPYTEELYQKLLNKTPKGAKAAWDQYLEWYGIEDQEWHSFDEEELIEQRDFQSEFWGSYDDPAHDILNAIQASSVKIFTRPHSKEELQKAGMWPKEV